ncbi:hypothetical protein D3C80_1941090 [compost metagenome]
MAIANRPATTGGVALASSITPHIRRGIRPNSIPRSSEAKLTPSASRLVFTAPCATLARMSRPVASAPKGSARLGGCRRICRDEKGSRMTPLNTSRHSNNAARAATR